MTWSNPPAAVSALRTMLLACPSIGIASGDMHYPAVDIGVDSGGGTAATLPCIALAEESHQRQPYAEAGVTGLPTGTLTATIYRDTDAGTLETYARTIAAELSAVVGLPNLSVEVGLCSDPTPAAHAADEEAAAGQTNARHRAIALTITYGLR